MQREIRFRIWDDINKKMLCPAMPNLDGKGAIWINDRGERNWDFIGGEEQYKVMQYTGLKDKNGCEIYEGDIVKNIKTGKMYTIKFHGVFAGFIYDDTFFNHSHKSDWGELYLCYLKLEVIGNIHENRDLHKNPELLEVGKDVE